MYNQYNKYNNNNNPYPAIGANFNLYNHQEDNNQQQDLRKANGLEEMYPELKYNSPYELDKKANPGHPNYYNESYGKPNVIADNDAYGRESNILASSIEPPINKPNVNFIEEKKPKNQISHDDFTKSVFKANQASTNFRINKTKEYKNIYKKDQAKAKILEKATFEYDDNQDATTNLARSIFHGPKQNGGLTVSKLNKTKKNEKKEGYLLKKNRYALQGWTRRFCKIKNKKFLYYDVKNLKNALGCIDFDAVTITLEEKGEKKLEYFTLSGKNSYKVFQFKVSREDNNEKLEDWIKIIKSNLEQSQGQKKNLINHDMYYKFWKSRVITEENFRGKVDTLDLLLFRGLHAGAKVQRFFTRSEYDHVAIFLRSGEDLYFLEATGTDGVGLCNWKTFVRNKWNLLYEKLVFRHLKILRTEEMMQTFQDFIKSVLQSDYEISIKKLLKFESRIGKPEEYKGRTFFCSELVASVYKCLKLLKDNISATQYWPGSFSKENGALPLVNCKLSDEYLIEFSKF